MQTGFGHLKNPELQINPGRVSPMVKDVKPYVNKQTSPSTGTHLDQLVVLAQLDIYLHFAVVLVTHGRHLVTSNRHAGGRQLRLKPLA